MNIIVPKDLNGKKITIEVEPHELIVMQTIINLYDGRCQDPTCACQDILEHVRDTTREATQYCASLFEKEIIQGFKKS